MSLESPFHIPAYLEVAINQLSQPSHFKLISEAVLPQYLPRATMLTVLNTPCQELLRKDPVYGHISMGLLLGKRCSTDSTTAKWLINYSTLKDLSVEGRNDQTGNGRGLEN